MNLDGELAARECLPQFDQIPLAMAASAYLDWIRNLMMRDAVTSVRKREPTDGI